MKGAETAIAIIIALFGNMFPPVPAEATRDDVVIMENMINCNAKEDHTGEVYLDEYGWIRLEYTEPYQIMECHLTRLNGSIDVYGHHETWYSTSEPGGKATAKPIPGKHVADDGTIRDEAGYICVASSDLPFFSTVMTSVGPGKVYDCGCRHGIVDVYTTW